MERGVALRRVLEELEARTAEYAGAGSEEAIDRQHAKGKLTIPERLDRLLDPEGPRFEVATFAALGTYEEHGDIRSAGVRTVIGQVSGRDCVVIANDSIVKSGTWFPLTIKKILRAQEIALENRLPLVYLVDSGGLFLPLQDESFPDRDHAGRIFFNNARISAEGIPQIAAVMGPCVAGGAYIPALCDELLMVKGTSGIFLAGPHLVKAAIGEEADIETLGGASTHMRLSGMADYEDEDEDGCLARVRRLASEWPGAPRSRYARGESRGPSRDSEELIEILPEDRASHYETRDVLDCILDAGSWEEYKPEYGQSLLTATARLEGLAVGVVASQRRPSRTARGETQLGGVIYADAADKAARFILACNQKQLPLLFFQDVTGFMIGTRAEQGGIIKDGAKLVNAVSNSRVPKLTVVMGNSYGAGNYALCGRSFGPRFMLAWPTASIGVMAARNAAETIRSIERGRETARLEPTEEEAFLESIRERYEHTLSPYHAAANLWVDALIDPRRTRAVLAHLLRIACAHDPEGDFRLGVFQV